MNVLNDIICFDGINFLSENINITKNKIDML
jgi:hypothetical protein